MNIHDEDKKMNTVKHTSTNKKICVYTCLTGNYDILQDVEIVDENADFICFTNNKDIKSKTWKIIYIDNDGLNNHQLSRKIKMLGTEYINKKYEISVWQDASVIWKKKPSEFVKKYLKNNFSAFVHNERNSVYDEACEVIRLRKDDKQTVLKHLAFLKKENFPDNLGLYEMTVFIKRHNNPVVKETMKLWYEIYLKYSKRDQLSFMYAIWKTKLSITPIKMNVWNNEWVKHVKHNYKEKIEKCSIYFEENIENDINICVKDYKYKIKEDYYFIEATIPKNTNTLEIIVTDVPCIKFDDISLNLKYDSIQIFNTIPYKDENLFYNNKGIIVIKGDFKEKQKLLFSIKLKKLTDYEKYNIIEQLGNDLITASDDIEVLKNQREELNKIVKEQAEQIKHPIKNLIKKIINILR